MWNQFFFLCQKFLYQFNFDDHTHFFTQMVQLYKTYLYEIYNRIHIVQLHNVPLMQLEDRERHRRNHPLAIQQINIPYPKA